MTLYMALLNLLGFAINGAGLWATWLCGNHHRMGWMVNAVAQIGWVVYAVLLFQWGLIPGTIAWGVIYYRNWKKWKTEHEEGTRPWRVGME